MFLSAATGLGIFNQGITRFSFQSAGNVFHAQARRISIAIGARR
jgi:hypothetical protein